MGSLILNREEVGNTYHFWSGNCEPAKHCAILTNIAYLHVSRSAVSKLSLRGGGLDRCWSQCFPTGVLVADIPWWAGSARPLGGQHRRFVPRGGCRSACISVNPRCCCRSVVSLRDCCRCFCLLPVACWLSVVMIPGKRHNSRNKIPHTAIGSHLWRNVQAHVMATGVNSLKTAIRAEY